MRPGKLRHRITFEKATDVQDPTFGVAEINWSPFVTVWGSISPISTLAGSERVNNDIVAAQITHRVITRYMPGVTNKMRIKFGSRYFAIESIANIDERNIQLEILCNEQRP